MEIQSPTGSTDSKDAEQDFKFIVRTIKRQLTASECFIQFIQLSSSHAVIMQENLQAVQSILLQIILNLLSSFKFKFVTTVECNGFGRRPLFTEMVHQMDRYKMHDYVHWSQIIAEAKKDLDKFINVNKAKYEDLVQFIHLTLDHIAKNNIKLDCESFAILFNTQVTSNMPPVKDLDLTPILPKPAHLVNAQLPKPKKGQKSVGRSSTSSCSHVRKLNFEIEYQLKPIEVTPIKSYRRPDKYKAIVSPFEETQPIPLEPNSPANMDPRLIHMFKRTPKPIEPRRFLGRITVHIGSGDEPEISRPAKRRRVVWDLS